MSESSRLGLNLVEPLNLDFTCEVKPGMGLDWVLTSIGFHILVYLLKLGLSSGLS